MTPDTTVPFDDDAFDISICIATFRRPQRLERLLESLRGLDGRGTFLVEVVIVDNDAAESARPIVHRFRERSPYPVRYCVEPQQNVALARNRTVDLACGTWIAFIDDDEVADPNWLGAFWNMQAGRPGDGYFGAVLPHLEEDGPAWLDKDVFFAMPRFATGTEMRAMWTYSGNAFVRRSLFASHRFDPRFARCFEDVDLFARMLEAGSSFYFCDEAVTHEHFPRERMRYRSLVQRHFRGGFMSTRLGRLRRPQLAHRLPGFLKACGGACLFALMLPFELLRGRTYAASRFLRLTLQVGHLCEFLSPPSSFRESHPRRLSGARQKVTRHVG